jgi:hypothetical protein
MISTTVHACTLIPQHTLLDCLFAMSIRMYEKKRYCRLHGHFEGVSDGNVSPDNHAIHRLPISSPTNSQHNHQGIVRRTRCYVGWIGQLVIQPSIVRRFPNDLANPSYNALRPSDVVENPSRRCPTGRPCRGFCSLQNVQVISFQPLNRLNWIQSIVHRVGSSGTIMGTQRSIVHA